LKRYIELKGSDADVFLLRGSGKITFEAAQKLK
jgi:hypothetical protein